MHRALSMCSHFHSCSWHGVHNSSEVRPDLVCLQSLNLSLVIVHMEIVVKMLQRVSW